MKDCGFDFVFLLFQCSFCISGNEFVLRLKLGFLVFGGIDLVSRYMGMGLNTLII